ncbi:MAG: hypothetical protein WBA65_14325 [Rhodanobacter sp.]|uniref:hypothetical protein n=1 Tax=Castellaniella sp. TaxID=1955812 RepID=UPI003C752082
MASLYDRFSELHLDVIAYSRGLEQDARQHVLTLGEEIAALLAGVDLSRLNRRQMNALIASVVTRIDGRYRRIDRLTDTGLTELLAVITPEIARAIRSRRRIPPKVADVLVSGMTTAESWESASQGVRRNIRRALRMAQAAGMREATEPIFGRGGVIEKSARNVQSAVQEMTLAAETEAKRTAATETSLISGYRSSSMFDSKTCLLCGNMDGELFDLNMVAKNEAVRAIGASPYHTGCRCNMIPELPEDGPASAIPGADGKVSRGMTFEEFVETKSAKWQGRYFGPGRYAIWKRGDITLSDLINGQGKIITISDLKNKYGGD